MPANDVTLATNYTTDYVESPCSLKTGWNLITPTGAFDSESIELLMAFKPFGWDARRRIYVRADSAMIEAGAPLWLFCRNAEELTLYVKPVASWNPSFRRGWNLVGAPVDVPAGQLPAKVLPVWEWTRGRWAPVTDGLKAGKGYWIFAE